MADSGREPSGTPGTSLRAAALAEKSPLACCQGLGLNPEASAGWTPARPILQERRQQIWPIMQQVAGAALPIGHADHCGPGLTSTSMQLYVAGWLAGWLLLLSGTAFPQIELG